MSQAMLYSLSGVALVGVSLYAMIAYTHLLRKVLALNTMASGVFLLLVGMARRHPADLPDPVPHALVLTGIVVAVSATAFALALACRVYDATGQARLPDGDAE